MVTPCASTLSGTWFYSTACADDPLADFRTYCSSVTTVSSTSTLSGRIDFLGANVSRQVHTVYATTVNLPNECLLFGATCSQVQAVLQNTVPNALCMTATSPRSGCDCSVSGTNSLNETGTWTADGGVVTVVTPSKTRTFNTCVVQTGSVLQLRETTSSLTGTEKGSTTLNKR